jgi:hypothetical protein
VRQLLAAPVNSVPGTQTTCANVPLAFTVARGNSLFISDTGTGHSQLSVTLTATHGVLSLPNADSVSGLVFSAGDCSAESSMTFTGTLGEINTALEWISFKPDSGYVGTDAAITIRSEGPPDDVTGEVENDTDVIAVEITDVAGADQVFSVLDFGATGDGLTDDAPAIRATIAAAIAAGGGTIQFPPGTYLLETFDPSSQVATYFELKNCEGLRFSGSQASLTSASHVRSSVFSVDGARRIEFEGFSVDGDFARHGSSITRDGFNVFSLVSTERDSENIRIANVRVKDVHAFAAAMSDLSTPYRVRNVSIENCQILNGRYGLNFRNNGDNVTVRNFKTEGVIRSYFPYGVDCHDIEYTSIGGDTFTDCLIKAYQRDTTNINVTVTVLDNTSEDAKLTLESQHNPWTQSQAARLRNIRVHFDDTASIGPKSVRFSYFQDTPNPVQTSNSPVTLFDNVMVSGRARNATEFAVHEAVPGTINTTWLKVMPATGLSSTSVSEDQPIGGVIGMLSTTGASAEGAFSYTLVPGVGGVDNASFATVGNQLQTATPLDFETQRTYSVRVRRTAEDGTFGDHIFTIRVEDVDEFDVGEISDIDTQADGVNERAARGTHVGITARAADADGSNRTVTYSLIDDASGRFVINNVTGVVSVADSAVLDFEQASSHSIVVRATSSDGSTSDAEFVVAIRDINEHRISSITDLDPGPSSIAENSPVGTLAGVTVHAFDADGTNNQVTYSLWSNAGGRFAIDPLSGVVTVADSRLLDRESTASWTITALATSADGSATAQQFKIHLDDVDEFDVGQVFDLNAAPGSILENSPGGTLVGITAFAIDLDVTNNAVTYSLSNSAGGRFAIDHVTGVVTVAEGALIDREEAASWTVTVVAAGQDGSSSSRDFVIALVDVDEFGVGVVSDRDAAPNRVVENAVNGTLVGITGFGVDLDATQSNVTYSLSSTQGGRFAIHSTTGVVTVANGALLDREAAASWSITVLATGQDASISIQEFTIHIGDVDEYNVGQVLDLNSTLDLVAENATNGTIVGITGFAVDLDATNSAVTYTLENNAGGRFAIHPTTGVVTVANGALLDREAAAESQITVRATSTDGSMSRKSYVIQIADVDDLDVGDVSDVSRALDRVQENSAGGTLVGITARAVDADVTNNAVAYRLSDSAGGRFRINPTTGVVSVAAGAILDAESATSHEITVEAKSSDGSVSQQTFVISVVNVFDAPRLTLSNSSVPESQPAGTLVGTLGAADLEAPTGFYTLVSGTGATDNSRFVIEGNQVRTRSPLNFELRSTYSIRVQMTLATGAVFTQVFTITATDVNENPTGLTLSRSEIPINNAVGDTVGSLAGIDADRGDQLSYSLVAGTGSTDNNRFAIDGQELKTAEVFLPGRKRIYSIRLRVTDASGLSYERVLTIRLAKASTRIAVGPK